MAVNNLAFTESGPKQKNCPFIYNTISREISSFWQKLVLCPAVFHRTTVQYHRKIYGQYHALCTVLLTVASARIRDIREKTAHGGGVCCRLDADDATPIHISTVHRYVNHPPLKSRAVLISNLSWI